MPEAIFELKQSPTPGVQIQALEREDVRGYIIDMVDQLSIVASSYGEQLLSAMLAEVTRRQRLIDSPELERPTNIRRL